MSFLAFEFQLKLLKICGILEIYSERWKFFIKVFHTFNILVNFCGIIMLLTFIARNYENIYEVSECLTSIITAIVTVTKLFLLYLNDDILEIIKNIRKFNEKCEWRLMPFFVKDLMSKSSKILNFKFIN